MRGKNKSLLEDAIIISILLVLIYGIYTLFFSSDEIQQIEVENKPTLEQKIETPKEIIKEENPPIKAENKVEEITVVTENKNIVEKQNPQNEVVIQEKIAELPKQMETNIEQTITPNDEKAKIELFYQNIRGKIDSNIDKSSFKPGEYINIRLTILKDGKQEQLTFMDGNKEYFELIKPLIYKTFPIEIPSDLKNNFPRYFRMKIEF